MFQTLRRYYTNKKDIIRKLLIHPYILFVLPALPYLLSRIYWEELPQLARGLLILGSILVPIAAIILGREMVTSESNEVKRGGNVVRFSGLALLVSVTLSNGIGQHADDNLLLLFLALTAGYALKAYENFERREANSALLHIAERQRQKSQIIREYGKILEMPGVLFRRESDLPYPKPDIRRALADALLRNDLDANTRNAFEVGFSNLEFFLSQDDYTGINAFVGTIWNSRNFELSERARRGEDVSKEMKAVAQQIVGVADCKASWDQVINRIG